MSVVVASGLTKTFGAGTGVVTAVNDVDLSLDAGEVVLHVGPSGSGKTTLLYMLGGLLRPTRGSVRIAGRPLASDPVHRARQRLGTIGFAFPDVQLAPGFQRRRECRAPAPTHGYAGPHCEAPRGRGSGSARPAGATICEPQEAARSSE